MFSGVVNTWEKILKATRREAAEAGDVHYFTGQPCKHGHIEKRYTITGVCVACNRVRFRKINHEVREMIRETRKQTKPKTRIAGANEAIEETKAQETIIGHIKPRLKHALIASNCEHLLHECIYALLETASDLCGQDDAGRLFLEEAFLEVLTKYEPTQIDWANA